MKRINRLLLLAAVLALAGIVAAQQQSPGKPAPSPQNSASGYAGWWCPMAQWAGSMGYGMPGPNWKNGGRYMGPRGGYGWMGPGMMYGPYAPQAGSDAPQAQAAPRTEQPQQKPSAKP